MIKKFKWKCRVLLIKTPNYKHQEYLKVKKIYQLQIKNFHKRTIKLIPIIQQKKFSIELIDFDGKNKLSLKRLNYRKLFKFLDQLSLPKNFDKKIKPINLSLFSDYNPKTTTYGLGFKDKGKAVYTINAIKRRNLKYQVNVIATMLGRAKKHPNQSKGMKDAIKVFNKWMVTYKKNKKSKK